jgi:hypothetical protein
MPASVSGTRAPGVHGARWSPLRSAAKVEERALARDQASFESFFEDTRARLFGALMVVTGIRHEAEEADT